MKDEGEPKEHSEPIWNKYRKGGTRRTRISLLRFFAGIIVWIGMSYTGTTYFPEGLWYIFGILGFALGLLIIYNDKWYPRFRRWRKGY